MTAGAAAGAGVYGSSQVFFMNYFALVYDFLWILLQDVWNGTCNDAWSEINAPRCAQRRVDGRSVRWIYHYGNNGGGYRKAEGTKFGKQCH